MLDGESKLSTKALKNIAIFRALFLGDLLCSIPAIRALHKALPEASVSLISLPWANDFVTRFDSYINEFVEFPGYPGLPERSPDLQAIHGFIAGMQARNFDLVIQMHGSGKIVNPLVLSFGGKNTAGFYSPDETSRPGAFFIPYPEGEPEVIRMARLVEGLGIPVEDYSLEFPISPADLAGADSMIDQYHLIPGEYICLHPGARSPDRRWPAPGFVEVGNLLADRGYQVVLTGSENEKDLVQSVYEKIQPGAINLCGKTDLGSLAGILLRSKAVICNDTGVSHVADALKIPSVVLFSGSDPERWAPLDRELHRVISTAALSSAEVVVDVLDSLVIECVSNGI